MGQKVNPIGLRLGINRTWDSRWYAARGEYGKLLHEDMRIREVLMKELKMAAVSRIIIERPHKKCRVTIYSARPGVVIGKKGADIDKIRKTVAKLTDSEVVLNIVEVRKPEVDATLVAELAKLSAAHAAAAAEAALAAEAEAAADVRSRGDVSRASLSFGQPKWYSRQGS
jgi:ribosomal protein S3